MLYVHLFKINIFILLGLEVQQYKDPSEDHLNCLNEKFFASVSPNIVSTFESPRLLTPKVFGPTDWGWSEVWCPVIAF